MIVAAIFKFKMADIVNQIAIARPSATKLQAYNPALIIYITWSGIQGCVRLLF